LETKAWEWALDNTLFPPTQTIRDWIFRVMQSHAWDACEYGKLDPELFAPDGWRAEGWPEQWAAFMERANPGCRWALKARPSMWAESRC